MSDREKELIVISRMRYWATDSAALVFPCRIGHITVALFPEDIISRPDDQKLIDYIYQRARDACHQH